MNTRFDPDYREIMAAAADAIALRSGMAPRAPHPLADRISLKQIAHACGVAAPGVSVTDDRAIQAFGMKTPDFSRALADGVRPATVAAYVGAAEHLAYTARVDVKKFLPEPVGAIESGTWLEPLGEGSEIRQGIISLMSLTDAERQEEAVMAQITSYGRAMLVTRHLVLSDMVEAIVRSFTEMGASAGRIEARMAAQALESNAPLGDGAVPFDIAYGNYVAEALSAAALGRAMSALRQQKSADGQPMGWRPQHLVVGADLELQASTLVLETGVNLNVTANTWLPTSRWYLMADPALCPVLAVLRLGGAEVPIRVDERTAPMEYDGAGAHVVADLGACLMRRTGIVRGGI